MSKQSHVDFLIVGAGRGGTSLLMGLLDHHPQLDIGHELHAMDCLMGFDLPSLPKSKWPQLLPYRIEAFVTRCRDSAQQRSAEFWGNKITTEQIYGLNDENIINEGNVDFVRVLFEEYFPDTKVIFILRDGRTCIRSKLNRTPQTLPHAIHRWRFSVQVLERLQQFHKQLLVIKYEDLVVDTEAELGRACEFLGVSYRKEMLSGVGNEKMRNEYRSHKVHRHSLALSGIAPTMLPLILDELKRHGYVSKPKYWWLRLRQNRFINIGLLITSVILLIVCVLLILR